MNTLIACHPSRLRGARAIRDRIGYAEVVLDPDPLGEPSAIRTYTKALQKCDPDLPTLILQDDALPHPDIRKYADRSIVTHPTSLIALYVGSVHAGGPIILRAARRGRRYVNLPFGHFVPTVALVWPAGAPGRFVDWLAEHPRAAGRYQDDEAIKEWRRALGRRAPAALASIPSLCRHDNRLASLLNHGSHGHRDALIPWDGWTRPDSWKERW